MRALLAVVLLSVLAAGCTPYIPVKRDFGTSAGVPTGEIPPEFEAFNVYNPRVNALLADQICATPPQPIELKPLDAVPGRILAGRARCQQHIPLLGP